MAGPFSIRLIDKINVSTRGRANLLPDVKGYVAVFVCLVTRAVHLEAVMGMDAESFIDAYKRFTARRGNVDTMFSDNGGNFVKADKELRSAVESWQSTKVQNFVNLRHTNWKFIPPFAPHQGGLWEAAVKQMKHHMKRVIGPEKYSYEAMATLLAKIEACMNSRPICTISDDPDDLQALTPLHFIIGEPLILPLPIEHGEAPNLAIGLFNQLQTRLNSFWRRWSEDYLSSLMNRPKWQKLKENVKIGQLVLIKVENTAPTYWAFGRIIAVNKSDDGCVRSAMIKVYGGEVERPIQKLIILPIDDELQKYNS